MVAEIDTMPAEFMDEAHELCRGTEVVPEGALGLAKKIKFCREQKRPMRVKLGVDPTSSDLHIGHAVILRKLRKFQEFGHQVVLIIGGFTAQIGDPSGRNSARPTLTAEDVADNAKTYLNQVGAILDLSKTEITNNVDWLAPLNLNDLLKLAGKVTVNQLLQKEAFGERYDNQLPVFFHELFYPLLQGYDSVAIKADIELGGTDQRFNILMGRELQPFYLDEAKFPPQLGMFLPLLEGTDGEKKMSKSFANYIGLKEPPDDMFGKTMRIPDRLLVKYYELTTDLSGRELDEIKTQLEAGASPMDAKKTLGWHLVKQYHDVGMADKAKALWTKLHSEKELPDEMPLHVVAQPTALFRLLVDTGLAGGTGDAKRLIQQGGVRVDQKQEFDPNKMVSVADGREIVVQIGNRKFVRLVAK